MSVQTLMDSDALSSILNVLKFFMRVAKSFLSFLVTQSLDGLSTTLVLVWPELMTADEARVDENSHESQLSSVYRQTLLVGLSLEIGKHVSV